MNQREVEILAFAGSLRLGRRGLLISPPEYNSSFSTVLKNTLDWVSRPASEDEAPLSCFTDRAVRVS